MKAKDLVKRIIKITGLPEQEAFGSLISFRTEVRLIRDSSGDIKSEEYPDYTDDNIRYRLRNMGYL